MITTEVEKEETLHHCRHVGCTTAVEGTVPNPVWSSPMSGVGSRAAGVIARWCAIVILARQEIAVLGAMKKQAVVFKFICSVLLALICLSAVSTAKAQEGEQAPVWQLGHRPHRDGPERQAGR